MNTASTRLVLVIMALILELRGYSYAMETRRDDEKVLKKFTEALNNFRRQLSIEGMRKLYWDEELTRMAQEKLETCDRTPMDHGNEGSFSIGLFGTTNSVKDMHTLTNTNDSNKLTRNTLDRQKGLCKNNTLESACRETLQLFNPRVWLIGCAINYNCQPESLVTCFMNRRMTEKHLPMRTSLETLPICSESFKVGCQYEKKCFCELKDPSLPRNLPEDKQELILPASRSIVDGRSSDGIASENSSARRFSMFLPILFFTTILPLLDDVFDFH